MATWTKVLIALLVTLPIGGYVVGTLVTNAPEPPGRQQPIQLRDATPTPAPESTPAPPASDPAPEPETTAPEQQPEDQVEVVTPEPTRVNDDDDRGDDGDDDGGDDDERDDTDDASVGGDD